MFFLELNHLKFENEKGQFGRLNLCRQTGKEDDERKCNGNVENEKRDQHRPPDSASETIVTVLTRLLTRLPCAWLLSCALVNWVAAHRKRKVTGNKVSPRSAIDGDIHSVTVIDQLYPSYVKSNWIYWPQLICAPITVFRLTWPLPRSFLRFIVISLVGHDFYNKKFLWPFVWVSGSSLQVDFTKLLETYFDSLRAQNWDQKKLIHLFWAKSSFRVPVKASPKSVVAVKEGFDLRN